MDSPLMQPVKTKLVEGTHTTKSGGVRFTIAYFDNHTSPTCQFGGKRQAEAQVINKAAFLELSQLFKELAELVPY